MSKPPRKRKPHSVFANQTEAIPNLCVWFQKYQCSAKVDTALTVWLRILKHIHTTVFKNSCIPLVVAKRTTCFAFCLTSF